MSNDISSIFDILGPVMIGPSSSHTAGAERLGKAARMICGSKFTSAIFYLHGSFAKTYKGHGTDRALVAGILGMDTDDEQIINAFDIAKEKGIDFTFIEADLGDVHPNTVKIVLTTKDNSTIFIIGSSIGGGSIIVTNINGDKVSIDCEYPVIIIKHKDMTGMISKITSNIALYAVNIATLKVERDSKGNVATTVIETDNCISDEAIHDIEQIDGVISVRSLDAI